MYGESPALPLKRAWLTDTPKTAVRITRRLRPTTPAWFPPPPGAAGAKPSPLSRGILHAAGKQSPRSFLVQRPPKAFTRKTSASPAVAPPYVYTGMRPNIVGGRAGSSEKHGSCPTWEARPQPGRRLMHWISLVYPWRISSVPLSIPYRTPIHLLSTHYILPIQLLSIPARIHRFPVAGICPAC